MEYLVLLVGAAAILMIARSIYNRFERWNRSQKLRGPQECLDAVHDTLANLAKSNPKV
jgi:hypothetical protein